MQNNNKDKQQTSATTKFASSIAKFSISTYVNFGISALGMLLTSFLIKDLAVVGDISIFTQAINLIAFTGMLGLDKSLIRFFKDPPAKTTSSALFRACLFFSSAVLLITGVICTLFSKPINAILSFSTFDHPMLVPALFFSSFLWAVCRMFSVLYRMEEKMLLFSLQSIATMFCFRLFYFAGAFFRNQFAAMVVFMVVGLALVVLVFAVISRKELLVQKDDFSPAIFKTILPYGLYNAPTTIILYLNNVMSLSVVKAMMGGGARGVYSLGMQLGIIVTTVQAGFATFWGGFVFANYKPNKNL